MQSNTKIQPILIELAWLFGSWAFSFGLVWKLMGHFSGTIDIQMHNIYFVLSAPFLASLFFLLIAPGVTGLRILLSRFRNRAATLVLGLLGGIWLLIMLAAFAGWALK